MTREPTVTAIPGPRGIPLLGRAGSTARFYSDPIGMLRRLHATHGSLAAVTAGDPSLVCGFGPEINHQVLSDRDLFHNAAELPIRIPKGSALERLTNFLVGMNGEEHRRLRRAMVPLFGRSHLDQHRDGIVKATESVLAGWKTGEELDLSATTAEIALCIAFRCLFDLDVASEARSLANLALGFTSGATSLPLILAPIALPGLPYHRFLKHCERLEQKLLELIRERRPTAAERHDALSVLMQAEDDKGNKLGDTQLIGLANELFIAGHETTARAVGWTLFLLERHPKVLADLLDELSAELRGDAPTVEKLQRLPLLDAIVKESLRLLSPTPFLFFRKNTAPLRVAGYELPTGSAIVISPLITHHMPELYPEPNRFKPERWSAPEPGPYEYLPLGAGPRSCLGAPLANVSVRVVVAMIVQRYRLTLPPSAEVSYHTRGIILGTKNGMRARVDRQDRCFVRPQPLRGNMGDLVDLPAA